MVSSQRKPEPVFYNEASTLGWPPGSWPTAFNADGVDFMLQRIEDHQATYIEADEGMDLPNPKTYVVFND